MLTLGKSLLSVGLFFWLSPAFGADANVTGGVMQNFRSATESINTQLVAPALITATAALTLQWILTYAKEVFNGDLSNTLAKAVGLISWFGFAVLLIKSQTEFGSYFEQYAGLAASLSGLSDVQFSPGHLIDNATMVIAKVNEAFERGANRHFWQVGSNMFAALMLVFANIFTYIAFLVIALSVFVAQLEFWVMFSVAPLAFALIPLSAFRDQGFAPIKGLISLGLRIIILGIITAVVNRLTDTLVTTMNSVDLNGYASAFDPVWHYLAGMAACAMMAITAGKIAAAIASGSASFSGADAIRGGLQMASVAAVGTAAVAGGALAAKSAMSAVKDGAYGAGHGVGKMLGEFANRGNTNVMPSPPGGQSAGNPAAMGGLGAPLDQPRPSPLGDSQSSRAGGGERSGGAPAAPGGSSAPAGGGQNNVAAPVAPAAAGNAASDGGGATMRGGDSVPGVSSNVAAPPAQTAAGVSSPGGDGLAAAGGGQSPAAPAAASGGEGASTFGGDPSAVPAAGMGDARSAGIGGADGGVPSKGLEKQIADLAQAMQEKKPSAMQRLGSATRTAGEQHAQDGHAVHVSINTRGDG